MVLMAGFKKSYSAISPLCMRIRNCFVFSYVKDKVNALCSTSQTWRTHFFTTKDTKFTKRRVYATFLPTLANAYVKDKVNAFVFYHKDLAYTFFHHKGHKVHKA
jgi:hypothetical protein